jgi:diphthamide biosynthesis enzyme Dph1/Dph2-like protein
LKADIIVRIGNSCLTRNKQLPVYFLTSSTKEMRPEIISDVITKLSEETEKEKKEEKEGNGLSTNQINLFVFYDFKLLKSFSSFSSINNNDNNFTISNLRISDIAYNPDKYAELNSDKDFLLYSRIFRNSNKIQNYDKIIYFGEESDKLLVEICLKYANSNKIYLCDYEGKINELNSSKVNSIFYKRFNLIQKAKESEVFGILVGSLSVSGLNDILENLKSTLKSKNKKFYTLLLGKITLDKLSNFVDYIDCFILIACPFSNFYDFKTLMKPMVTALDIQIAFNEENFKWDMTYSFDGNFILEKECTRNKKSCCRKPSDDEEKVWDNLKIFTGLQLKDSEKNQALASIFSFQTLQNYDKKTYKGLNINEIKKEAEKFKIGKKGIPIKYEDIVEN